MTTSSITIIRPPVGYRSSADRIAVRVAAALVSWTNKRAERAVVSRERHVTILENSLAAREREHQSVRLHELG
jgi:hypothetical protein